MDISISSLLAGFIFGVFGFWMIREGRRNFNYRVVYIGVALIVYPYFIENPFLTWALGTGLCFLAYKIW